MVELSFHFLKHTLEILTFNYFFPIQSLEITELEEVVPFQYQERPNIFYLGGAIFGQASISNCSFQWNNAQEGGSCWLWGSSIIDSSFHNNTASLLGGAIALRHSNGKRSLFDNLRITDNQFFFSLLFVFFSQSWSLLLSVRRKEEVSFLGGLLIVKLPTPWWKIIMQKRVEDATFSNLSYILFHQA